MCRLCLSLERDRIDDAGSLTGAFVSIIAVPLQALRGLHRRHLLELFDAVEGELAGSGAEIYTARNHSIHASRIYGMLVSLLDSSFAAKPSLQLTNFSIFSFNTYYMRLDPREAEERWLSATTDSS
jgi:hypothetical protein